MGPQVGTSARLKNSQNGGFVENQFSKTLSHINKKEIMQHYYTRIFQYILTDKGMRVHTLSHARFYKTRFIINSGFHSFDLPFQQNVSSISRQGL
jgi:hypothetical protein